MTSLQSLSLTVVAGWFLYWTWQVASTRRRMKGAKAVPGPRGLPLLGNAMDLAKDPGLITTFNKWSKEYGPIVCFGVLGQKQIILSSDKVAHELFTKRAHIYSDRGTPAAASEYSGGLITAVIPQNDTWRRQRKLIRSVMNISVDQRFVSAMELESLYTLRDLIEYPDDFSNHLARYAYGVLTRTALGIYVNSTEHPLIQALEDHSTFGLNAFRPDTYLCNLAPWILKLPEWLVPSNGALRAKHRDMVQMMRDVRRDIEKKINEGTAADSFYQYFAEHQNEYGLTDAQGGTVFTTFLIAGTRSPHNALLSFLIAMMEYPEWFKKLQKELDDVVGPDRLPGLADVPNLPTLRAVVKEGIRQRSLKAELGVPHQVEKDDFYEGYFIPAGTVLHANYSAILADPEMYPDGPVYNPARWLDPAYPTYKEPLTQYPNMQNFVSFGYGRRACPGSSFTERSLVIMIARLAWACDIKRPIDPATKKPIDLDIKYEPVPNPRPLPFLVHITPRSRERTELVLREATTSFEEDTLTKS